MLIDMNAALILIRQYFKDFESNNSDNATLKKTPDFARLDDYDIYVQSTPLTEEEHKRLSAIIDNQYRPKAIHGDFNEQ
jgi:hypothetical protein